jgi:hypothetical protein
MSELILEVTRVIAQAVIDVKSTIVPTENTVIKSEYPNA